MANKRQAKKNIDYAVYTVVHDCLTHVETSKEPKDKEVYNIMGEVINLRNDLFDRVNHTPKDGAKAYYKELHKDLFKGVEQAFQKLSEVIKK